MSIKAVFYFNDKTVTIHSENTEEVSKKFRPGYYSTRINHDNSLTILCEEFKEVHEPYPNQKSGEILDTISKFLEKKNMLSCNEMGYIYKLNVLLHGDQGVGKTSLLTYMSYTLYHNHDAIIFRIDGQGSLERTWMLAEEIRKIQDNPIIFLIDEFEQYASKGYEHFVKNLLDGNRSINNSVVLAATNYIESIPKTLKERPSRFRIVSKIEHITDKETIRHIINNIHSKAKFPFLTEDQINDMVAKIETTTVDEIKTSVIDILMELSLELPITKGVGFNNRERESENEIIDEFKKIVSQFNRASENAYPSLNYIERPENPVEKASIFNHTNPKGGGFDYPFPDQERPE